MTIEEQIKLYLEPLPSEWRDKLTKLLCEINNSRQKPDCDDFKECETLTSLSDFEVQGTTVSVKYKDEKSVTYTRSFDIAQAMNNSLDGLQPKCLASQVEWDALSYQQRLQLLIDKQCDCCE